MTHFSNKTHYQAVLYYVKHPMLILLFFLLTGTILFFFSLNKLKKVFISFSFLFLASSFFAIYIPKNGFTHYFVLAVVPISIFVSNLVTLDQESFKKKLIYLFTIILFITYGQLESRNSKYIFSVCPPIEKNKTYANAPITKIEPTLDSLILKDPKTKPKIFISGWFTAQYYYYKYHNFIKPVYRSSYTFYLNKFSGDIYEKDLLQFWEDIEKTELPDIIVKLPEYPFISKKFDLLLANKYRLFEVTENNHIYVLNK